MNDQADRVEVEDDSGVRLIRFARPEVLNAFDVGMYEATTAALRSALVDDTIRAVVLCGRGRAFSSGQDLGELAALTSATAGGSVGTGFPALLDTVVSFDKPLLAAVHGVAVGLGCTLLGHVDIALVEEGTRLRTPFAELGVPPEAASSWLLPERMGWQRAAELLLASEWIGADDAVAAGLALRVCPVGTVLEETLALARRIASFAPDATCGIKRLMAESRRPAVAAARAREDAAYAALFADSRMAADLAAGSGS